MMKQSLLSVESLEIVLRRKDKVVPVVGKVNFQIDKGEIFGLVGESGCGKTMTCLSILNLLPVGMQKVGGHIQLAGKNLEGLSTAEWRKLRGDRIALVMQNPMSAFDAIRTIGDHFVETLLAHGKTDKKAARQTAVEYLSRVGLPDANLLLRQYPFELSGGMLQRVIIAIALAQKPDLIIADEPTTALDATSQIHILDLLAKVRREFGTSILLISHDLGVIARLADSVAVMYGGQFVEQAPVCELFAQPLHPYTQLLMNARSSIGLPRRKRLSLLSAAAIEMYSSASGCGFARLCPKVSPECLVTAPKKSDANVSGHWVRCLNVNNEQQEVV
ncbi:Oligopeptide transport ATP-binding protein OppD [Sporomusa silvacetica DSM 10669]|uniref:Oligopeptide transport ATP-binding protein OppD n=1 Tax=Sporomusa silvacetica DSM 10669 TaxID=1123289 RepID=A0ABZ3IIT6_9FIRM|nr:ABC transporter ATP-binding protein [Sporomusa silvacetica]OZC18398.1 oligopeptide transport ATP-binding protein OppD [Sporomusa silvacetica DSM 10669]